MSYWIVGGTHGLIQVESTTFLLPVASFVRRPPFSIYSFRFYVFCLHSRGFCLRASKKEYSSPRRRHFSARGKMKKRVVPPGLEPGSWEAKSHVLPITLWTRASCSQNMALREHLACGNRECGGKQLEEGARWPWIPPIIQRLVKKTM